MARFEGSNADVRQGARPLGALGGGDVPVKKHGRAEMNLPKVVERDSFVQIRTLETKRNVA